jgi:hypothetical protein
MKLDLNSTPAAGVLDLNLTPEDDGLLDLNSSPPQDEPIQDQHGGLSGVPDPNSSATHNEPIQDQHGGLSGVPDPNSSATHNEPIQDQHGGLSGLPGGVPREIQKNLTSQERYGVYFALKVIERKDGKFTTCDKELVASMLHTSVRSIERVWKTAQEQLEQGLPISSKKKGKCGGKRKDLDLSRTSTIPLNRRRTIRSLAKSLGVSRSTLHRRFRLGELKRVSNTLKPSMTEANKIQRLQHCLSMLDENSPCRFKDMDNFVHIDEKWFDMTRVNNSYYLLPEEPKPLRTVKNKNSIGKVMFLAAFAKPMYGEGGVVTFDGKIGIWAFVKETPSPKKSKLRPKGTLELKKM